MFRKFPSGSGVEGAATTSRRISAQVLLFLLLVASVALLINAVGFRQRLESVRTSSSDNVGWVVAQLEVDQQGLMLALMQANLEGKASQNEGIPEDDFDRIKREFDIFYSRVDIFSATVRRLPISGQMDAQLVTLSRLRDQLANHIDAITQPDAASLLTFQEAVAAAYPVVRETTTHALREITDQAATDRDIEEALFIRFFAQSMFLFALMGVGTFLVVRLWRELEARSIETSRIAAMLSTAFDSTLNGVVVADSQFEILYCNNVLRDLLGYEAEDLVGKTLDDILELEGLFAPEERVLAQSLGGKARLICNEKGVRQSVCRRKDGSEFPVEVALTQDEDLTGEVIAIGFLRNISDRVAAEENQTLALQQAEQAAQAKSRFLATMSHEMRTPLHGLMASLDLIDEGELSVSQQALFKTARDCSQRALMQVDDVLELTRLGESREAKAQLRPDQIVAEIVDELRPLAGMSDNHIDLVLQGAFDVYQFEGLPVAFSRAVYNLTGNAVKFTQGGEITVRLTLEGHAPDHFQLLVEVVDTGPGIAPADQQRIFNSFETAARSEVSTQTGTGLGLAIAKLAIEQQGGRLHLTSELGVGSRFYFSVPLRVLREIEAEAPVLVSPEQVAPELVENVPEEAVGKHILIVDDNDVNLTLMAEMVRRLGHSSELARNGQEAVDMAAKDYFDVILMDFSMPVMDGPTAAGVIRQSEGACAHSVIIGVTALIEAHMESGQAAMMDDVIVKPVSAQQLDAAIRNTVYDPIRDLSAQTAEGDDKEDAESIFGELCQMVGEDTALRLVQATLADGRAALQAIQDVAMPLEDKAEVVHKAVGSTGLIGFYSLSEALSEAESLAHMGRDPMETDVAERVQSILETISQSIDVLVQKLVK